MGQMLRRRTLTLSQRVNAPHSPGAVGLIALAELVAKCPHWVILRHRVVRLLHLRHRRGSDLQSDLLPIFDPVTGTLAAFASFSVGFIARPVGGAAFAHYGDKIGRKPMLVYSLLLMGARN
jgi:hypothetical protein